LGWWIERLYPSVLGLAAAACSASASPLNLFTASWRDALLEKVIAAFGILAAYLLTAIALLPALEDKSIVRKLKAWGYFSWFVDFMREALWSAGALIILSFAFVPLAEGTAPSHLSQLKAFLSDIWWGLLVFATASIHRVTRLLIKFILAG
jgi:hypothetical protein